MTSTSETVEKVIVHPLDATAADVEDEKVHVFGRNLEDRVITNNEEDSPSISFTNPNIYKSKQNSDEDDIDSIRKRKFDAITGEEDEETIFQGDFKLYIWDLATSNWMEKGRGQLKLNDSMNEDEKKSRLIMRISGTLRIILNVAINRSFFRVIANTKTNIRFTDSQSVWAASGTNAHQLRDLIDERLKASAEDQEAEEEKEQERKRNKTEIVVGEDSAPPKRTKSEADTNNQEISASPKTDRVADASESVDQKELAPGIDGENTDKGEKIDESKESSNCNTRNNNESKEKVEAEEKDKELGRKDKTNLDEFDQKSEQKSDSAAKEEGELKAVEANVDEGDRRSSISENGKQSR